MRIFLKSQDFADNCSDCDAFRQLNERPLLTTSPKFAVDLMMIMMKTTTTRRKKRTPPLLLHIDSIVNCGLELAKTFSDTKKRLVARVATI